MCQKRTASPNALNRLFSLEMRFFVENDAQFQGIPLICGLIKLQTFE